MDGTPCHGQVGRIDGGGEVRLADRIDPTGGVGDIWDQEKDCGPSGKVQWLNDLTLSHRGR